MERTERRNESSPDRKRLQKNAKRKRRRERKASLLKINGRNAHHPPYQRYPAITDLELAGPRGEEVADDGSSILCGISSQETTCDPCHVAHEQDGTTPRRRKRKRRDRVGARSPDLAVNSFGLLSSCKSLGHEKVYCSKVTSVLPKRPKLEQEGRIVRDNDGGISNNEKIARLRLKKNHTHDQVSSKRTDTAAEQSYPAARATGGTATVVKARSSPSTFLEKMRARLCGGQFRMLNEKLYTCSGKDAFFLFKDDPGAFQLYHAGYQEQMNRWPRQPLEVITDWLKERGSTLVVADFGCGDGRLAKCVNNRVFSLDLVALDSSVIACNMAHTPLSTSSVDVAVFCLSLMGTDYPSFLEEAYRVLKPRGWLLVAEVKSRFDPENGGADPQVFVDALKTLGFSLFSKDFSNKMFILFQFRKEKGTWHEKNEGKWPLLKPCIYKRR